MILIKLNCFKYMFAQTPKFFIKILWYGCREYRGSDPPPMY